MSTEGSAVSQGEYWWASEAVSTHILAIFTGHVGVPSSRRALWARYYAGRAKVPAINAGSRRDLIDQSTYESRYNKKYGRHFCFDTRLGRRMFDIVEGT